MRVYAALGILARLMPQLQVFFVAMPINILFGFVLMALLLGSMMTLFLNYYAAADGQLPVTPWLTIAIQSQQTEEPTQKRLDQAREHGDVVKSPEVSTFVLLLRRHTRHRHVRRLGDARASPPRCACSWNSPTR